MGVHFKLATATKDELITDSEYMRSVPYYNAIGSLMYGMIGTRPDLVYPVGFVSRFMSDPIKSIRRP